MTALREILNKANGVVAAPKLDQDRIFADYFVPKHKAYMELPESERRYSDRAVEHMVKAVTGGYKQPRQGRLSPSSIGTDCERELLFAYAQAPQSPRKPREQEVMDAGTMEHIRMQMVGLSAGYLDDVEIFVHEPSLRCGGSADGRGDDRSLWELKNTAGHLFDPIAKGPNYLAAALERERKTGKGSADAYAAKMVVKHKLQMETYWEVDRVAAALAGREPFFSEWGSLVYMHREKKTFYEIRIRSSASRRKTVQAIIESATGWIDIDQLPDRLIGCQNVIDGEPVSDKEKRRFQTCHFAGICTQVDDYALSQLVLENTED